MVVAIVWKKATIRPRSEIFQARVGGRADEVQLIVDDHGTATRADAPQHSGSEEWSAPSLGQAVRGPCSVRPGSRSAPRAMENCPRLEA